VSLSRTRKIFAYTAVAALVAAAGWAAQASKARAAAAPHCVTIARPKPKPNGGRKAPKLKLDPAKHYDVTLVTNCGSFTIRLDVRHSPHTAASFAYLARTHFFDRTIFHRIVPGFVIQGGDPTGQGIGGPGYETVDRPPANTVYREYLAAMAKTQTEPAGTAGSQFFVVTGPGVQLPPDYAVLGTVYVGRKVVDLIGKLGDAQEQPTRVVEILRTTVRVS